MSQISDIGIMAAGATLVILIGGIDLSVAAVLALTMMFSAWLYREDVFPWPVAMIAGLALGALVGPDQRGPGYLRAGAGLRRDTGDDVRCRRHGTVHHIREHDQRLS